MSRNRLKNSQSLHWMVVLKWVLIVGLVSILGLSYMFCKNQNLHIAAETHTLQLQLDKIKMRNSELSLDLEGMKSPGELQRRLVRMGSSLVNFSDMRLTVVRRDESTRARIARNNGSSPVVADSASSSRN